MVSRKCEFLKEFNLSEDTWKHLFKLFNANWALLLAKRHGQSVIITAFQTHVECRSSLEARKIKIRCLEINIIQKSFINGIKGAQRAFWGALDKNYSLEIVCGYWQKGVSLSTDEQWQDYKSLEKDQRLEERMGFFSNRNQFLDVSERYI